MEVSSYPSVIIRHTASAGGNDITENNEDWQDVAETGYLRFFDLKNSGAKFLHFWFNIVSGNDATGSHVIHTNPHLNVKLWFCQVANRNRTCRLQFQMVDGNFRGVQGCHDAFCLGKEIWLWHWLGNMANWRYIDFWELPFMQKTLMVCNTWNILLLFTVYELENNVRHQWNVTLIGHAISED